MKSHLITLVLLIFFYGIANAQIPKEKNSLKEKQISLVPETPSKAPDYFCTWNIQGYLCSIKDGYAMRMEMQEKNMYGDSTFQNWLGFFPKIRQDIYFVMDDSWDIPNSGTISDYYGMAELDPDRFPSFTGTSEERMKKMVKAVKDKGWKGLGGWICVQVPPVAGKIDSSVYWTNKLQLANAAGFSYWKADWGKYSGNPEYRRMMTALGRKYAPNLIIEHAMGENNITFSDTYRTYDVENIISLPVTISRVAGLLKYKPENEAKGIINCEDEPYIAAGLGCAIGIMRHPFVGDLPSGIPDFAFPVAARDVKKRLDEVVRAVRWHRIAEPFGVGSGSYSIDTLLFTDTWKVEKYETWVDRKIGEIVQEKAPARVSRGLPLAKIVNPGKNKPYVLSSLYPNGAIAIATIGRTSDREYIFEKSTIEQEINSIDSPIGIFGQYESLTLVLPDKIKKSSYTIWAQDLAGDTPVNITKEIIIKENRITIPGQLITKIGLSAATSGDVSDPGLVIKFDLR